MFMAERLAPLPPTLFPAAHTGRSNASHQGLQLAPHPDWNPYTHHDRDQFSRLRAGREEQEHSPMNTPTETAITADVSDHGKHLPTAESSLSRAETC